MKLATIFFLLLPVLFITETESNYVATLFKLMRPKIEGIIDKSNIDLKCASDLKSFISDLQKLKGWALRMFDANGKIHPGILYGNIHQSGNYDQCLDINENRNGRIIAGQYCSVVLLTNNNITGNMGPYLKPENAPELLNLPKKHISDYFLKVFKIVVGLCIPKSCSIQHLQRVWDYIEVHFELPIHMAFEDTLCVHKDKLVNPYPIDDYVYYFFGVMLLVVLISTTYDIFLQQTGNKPNIFVSFSLYTNVKKLLETSVNNNDLTCLHGIRVVSIMWITLGHIGFIKSYVANTNSLYILKEFRQRFLTTFLASGHFGVDTFFAISGLLLVYVQMTFTEKRRMRLIQFYLHRIIRLLPALIATILVYISVLKNLSDGPIWPIMVKKSTAPCYETWWVTLLFANNFLKSGEQCVLHSWYLAVDTQLYIIAPFILFNIRKHPRKTIVSLIAASLVSYAYTYTMVVFRKLGYMLIMEDNEDHLYYIYTSPISRMPAWFIGIFFGYLIYHHKNQKDDLFKYFNVISLLVSLLAMLMLILAHHLFLQYEYDAYRSAFHNSFARTIWAFAVCNIIYICCTGQGGLINSFLSHPIFVVLSKLTYSMYLSHFMAVLIVAGYQRQAGHLSVFETLHEFCGTFVLVLIFSVLLCLFFETPFIVIQKCLEKSGKNPVCKSDKGTNTTVDGTINNYILWIYSTIARTDNVRIKEC